MCVCGRVPWDPGLLSLCVCIMGPWALERVRVRVCASWDDPGPLSVCVCGRVRGVSVGRSRGFCVPLPRVQLRVALGERRVCATSPCALTCVWQVVSPCGRGGAVHTSTWRCLVFLRGPCVSARCGTGASRLCVADCRRATRACVWPVAPAARVCLQLGPQQGSCPSLPVPDSVPALGAYRLDLKGLNSVRFLPQRIPNYCPSSTAAVPEAWCSLPGSPSDASAMKLVGKEFSQFGCLQPRA